MAIEILAFVVLIGVVVGLGLMLFKLQSKKAEPSFSLEEQRSQIESLVKNATGEAFQSVTKTLIDLAKSELSQSQDLSRKDVESLIKPLQDSVLSYKKEMGELEGLRNREMGSLDKLLKAVLETNQQLKSETSNLASALKSPTVRGRWGEVQLKRIVELSGMSSHCDFTEQLSLQGEDARLVPDMVIHLPNGRDIVVDAKAVLAGYLEAEEATDSGLRKAALLRHAQSLRARIQELSRKSYWEQFTSAPEFVVLFIPAEAFFSAALMESPDLIEFGFESRVILSTPTTLMALLKAVALGWRQEQLAENSRKIAEQASKLYQALGTWVGHLEQLGSSLEKSTKAYNSAVGSLEKSVLPPARKLKEMGASSNSDLVEIKQIELGLRDVAHLVPKVDLDAKTEL